MRLQKCTFRFWAFKVPGNTLGVARYLMRMLWSVEKFVWVRLSVLHSFPMEEWKGNLFEESECFPVTWNQVGEASKYPFKGPENVAWSFEDWYLHMPEKMRQMALLDHREPESCIGSKVQWHIIVWKGCINLTVDFWEEVGLKPFSKCFYSQGLKLDLWKWMEDTRKEDHPMPEDVQWMNLGEIDRCVLSPPLRTCPLSPKGLCPHMASAPPPIWPLMSHSLVIRQGLGEESTWSGHHYRLLSLKWTQDGKNRGFTFIWSLRFWVVY